MQMKNNALLLLILLFFGAVSASSEPSQETPPKWAYPASAPALDPDNPIRYNSLDWHPDEHPPAPQIILHGDKALKINSCAHCHRADGSGAFENASLMGLPVQYILQQMSDFKNGLRKSSVVEGPRATMIKLSSVIKDADLTAAANYFSAIKPKPNVKVVESSNVPKKSSSKPGEKAASVEEPLGNRIVEIPEDPAKFKVRDSHCRFVAYVPVGSIEKGKELANRLSEKKDKTLQCMTCHGPDLRGVGNIPGIAGRSPTYLFRQLYDVKSGARHGAGSVVMKPIVSVLSTDDMIALASYVGSLTP
jgi:cytochrome c553